MLNFWEHPKRMRPLSLSKFTAQGHFLNQKKPEIGALRNSLSSYLNFLGVNLFFLKWPSLNLATFDIPKIKMKSQATRKGVTFSSTGSFWPYGSAWESHHTALGFGCNPKVLLSSSREANIKPKTLSTERKCFVPLLYVANFLKKVGDYKHEAKERIQT